MNLRASRKLVAVSAMVVALGAVTAAPAVANTRDGANSYINTRTNVNVVPGVPSQYWLNAGMRVWMNCWTRGPVVDGQQKWFNITVKPNQPGAGLTGYVPATRVSNQWTSSPLCPPW